MTKVSIHTITPQKKTKQQTQRQIMFKFTNYYTVRHLKLIFNTI